MCQTVLIADDNELSLKIVARLFKSLGWCTILTRSANLIFPILVDNFADVTLLLTDYSLSERITALTIIEGVRQWERESQLDKSLPIIVFSAHRDVAAGADMFFDKPLSLQNVNKIVAIYGSVT
ncbi:hypothetical protein DFS34DRAFT_380047 [Phlyctochytrium arcticum]|nr:hypothetical protein DFS34DRAFT_598518 [Phlyctochytrium arcticum]KAI9089997.1 hypothetical protein DFS34DRAFT_379968 [Phlyctochytrium arcticum]KAI9090004.1 hypothetical protein DFS34DRAFT_380047 [Phlyctochytrium arcticum]